MFHVGQMVVCVDDENMDWRVVLYSRLPRKRDVFTVRCVYIEEYNKLGLLLEEIIGKYRYDGREYGFKAHRFRPVRQTSIEQFTSILNHAPQREDA